MSDVVNEREKHLLNFVVDMVVLGTGGIRSDANRILRGYGLPTVPLGASVGEAGKMSHEIRAKIAEL